MHPTNVARLITKNTADPKRDQPRHSMLGCVGATYFRSSKVWPQVQVSLRMWTWVRHRGQRLCQALKVNEFDGLWAADLSRFLAAALRRAVRVASAWVTAHCG